MADYIKWLELTTKSNLAQLDDNFRCFKNWTQWQLQPENAEIDDGDLDEELLLDSWKSTMTEFSATKYDEYNLLLK